jgi:hypothetical protein
MGEDTPYWLIESGGAMAEFPATPEFRFSWALTPTNSWCNDLN